LRAKIDVLRTEMNAVFKERSSVVEGLIAALLSGEHVLLLGPPGTAKSLLASTMSSAITDAQYFQWLLTKFSTPEELFGPISLKGLEEDRFRRNQDGKLPQAHLAFCDEIFKANSSILNALLTLLNERIVYNDGVHACPLLTLVGASNELPESDALNALFDRFLLRFWVDPIADRGNMKAVLSGAEPSISATLTLAEVEQAKRDAALVPVPDAILETLLDVKQATERAGFKSSDRRWRKILRVLKAHAYASGDPEVSTEHFDILPDMLWSEPKQRPKLASEIGKVANPRGAKAQELLDAAKELVAGVPDASVGRSAYLVKVGEATTELQKLHEKAVEVAQDGPQNRKLNAAVEEIKRLHGEIQKGAQRALGLLR